MPNKNLPQESETPKPNRVGRQLARRSALQALYQWQVSGNAIDTIEKIYLAEFAKKTVDIAYYSELIHGVVDHQLELDALFTPYLKRNFHEIDPIELTVLRIASYELLHRLEIPYRVIINEALEVVKKFGSVEGYKFVNSILDLLAKKVRIHE